MTILERVMTAWHLVDITPPRTSPEAEETKEKWKRKVQITFLVPSVKLRRPMPAFRFFEYLICFWSYQAHDYTITKPRPWPTCWSSSDENQLSSHGDIHPAIQTFILLVTMEPCHNHDTQSTLYHSIWSRPHVCCLFHCIYLCFLIFSILLVSPLIGECSVHSVSPYDYLICFHLQFWLLSVPIPLYLLIWYTLGNWSPISPGLLIMLHNCARRCSLAFPTPWASPRTFYSSI